jgi:hypothetical protein
VVIRYSTFPIFQGLIQQTCLALTLWFSAQGKVRITGQHPRAECLQCTSWGGRAKADDVEEQRWHILVIPGGGDARMEARLARRETSDAWLVQYARSEWCLGCCCAVTAAAAAMGGSNRRRRGGAVLQFYCTWRDPGREFKALNYTSGGAHQSQSPQDGHTQPRQPTREC